MKGVKKGRKGEREKKKCRKGKDTKVNVSQSVSELDWAKEARVVP
jgi:hypothetical protein